MVIALSASLAAAQTGASDQPGKPGESPAAPQLPPGWSEADMMACVEAGTPGKMHEFLTHQVGVWHGKSQTWMGPGATEAADGTCTWTVSSIFDGRYIKCELSGELPGMGPFTGRGLTGFDNVSQKFVGSWVDNHNTGIMQGVGELSKDGKSLAWTYSYNCPITKRPAVVRQVDHYTDADTMSFDMFSTDSKSGKEFKCMHVDFTRQK
jgi:hypothetical protein